MNRNPHAEPDRSDHPVSRRTLLGVLAAGTGVIAFGLPAPTAGAAQRAAAEQAVADYLDTSLPLDRRVDALLAELTDEQKLLCLTGLPALTLADGYHLPARSSAGVEGLHGSGQVAEATMFPQAIGFGSTWDTELVEAMGQVVGFEVRSRNPANLRAWAPVADVRSNPSPAATRRATARIRSSPGRSAPRTASASRAATRSTSWPSPR